MDIHSLHMRPLLAVAIKEAVKLALIDSCAVDATEEQRAEWAYDIYKMPNELYKEMDPGALAQNVACRLIGTGNWTVGKCYTGNATSREAVEACIVRPDQDPSADVVMKLGLQNERVREADEADD